MPENPNVLLICTDQVEKFVPVKKGKTHVLRVVREILFYKPKGRGTRLETAGIEGPGRPKSGSRQEKVDR